MMSPMVPMALMMIVTHLRGRLDRATRSRQTRREWGVAVRDGASACLDLNDERDLNPRGVPTESAGAGFEPIMGSNIGNARRGTGTARRFKSSGRWAGNRPSERESPPAHYLVEPRINSRPWSDGLDVDSSLNNSINGPVTARDLEPPVTGPPTVRVVEVPDIQIRGSPGGVGG